MALTPKPRIVDRAIVADACHNILQHAPVLVMKQHVVGNDGPHRRFLRHQGNLVQAQMVVRPAAQGHCHIGAAGKSCLQKAQAHRQALIGKIG